MDATKIISRSDLHIGRSGDPILPSIRYSGAQAFQVDVVAPVVS